MKRKLKLERETITELNLRDLVHVAGGGVATLTCPGTPTVYPCTSVQCSERCSSGSLTTTGHSLI